MPPASCAPSGKRTNHLGRRSGATTALAILAIASGLFAVAPAGAAVGECNPCIGISTGSPGNIATQLSSGSAQLSEDSDLVVRFEHVIGTTRINSSSTASDAIDQAGARPWISVLFSTPAPLLQNATQLEGELEELADLARAGSDTATYQLGWSGDVAASASDYAFLIKRAAVAVTGAKPDARVVTTILPGSADFLRALFAEEVAAYIDGVAVAREGELETVRDLLFELDPGTDLILDSLAPAADPLEVLAEAAAAAHLGATRTLHEVEQIDASRLDPFVLMANQFVGDLSVDPYSSPSGADAWSFVRGEDLSLLVVARAANDGMTRLDFTDRTLTTPRQLDPATGEEQSLFGGFRTRDGYRLEIEAAPAAFVVALERPGIAELVGEEGVADRVEVADERMMPVEEILRRLQAFEDDQRRRLQRYTAVQTQSLRFQVGTGVQSVDATFVGPYYFEQGKGFDWAWEEFYINGVRWRNKRIPEIPLIQPEKATAMPLEITFTKDYRYRLRGTDRVNGRDCWVVEFEPAIAVVPGSSSLFQGAVWVDREHYGRVRIRGVQLGLEGEVLSNEEITTYTPLDSGGQPGEWTRESYWLPLQVEGQRLFSILNGTVVVERELTLTELQLNPADYQERLDQTLASDATMVRDTDGVQRYLVKDEETGGRVVQEELDKTRFFLVGGAFYDEANDFPIPLAGVNWLSFDWRGTGAQANLFVAGPLVLANLADPDFLGSKFDLGVDIFALAFAGTDTLFRNGMEVPGEDVESIRPNIDLSIGRPIGNFFKLDFEYSFGWNKFTRADDTAEEFILPEDHFDHQFELAGIYNRRGYRLRLGGSYNIRSDWSFWGLPDNTDFDPEQDEYTLWNASIAKTWHLPKFTKFGLSVEYAGGDNLDRFSKYGFGFFSDITVHGYQSDKVRAEEVTAAHITYGVNIADIFRVDLVGDAAWATDKLSGLEDELLAGVGIVGTFIGPWSTIVNMDVGYAIEGPDDGFSAFIAFLKLFR